MALTPQIRAPEAVAIPVVRRSTPLIASPQAVALAVFNFPAEEIRSAQAVALSIFTANTAVESTQALTIPVYRGPVDNIKLRAWTFSLDTHDFYVLKLGTARKTLVLDLTTEQWAWWSTQTQNRWRSSIGMNWRSAGNIPGTYGTNVVVGDDSTGVLWVLNPLQGYDDSISIGSKISFPRVATAQMTVRGRESIPVNSVYLTADLGDPALEVNTVSLAYSDNQGRSFITADKIQVSVEGYYGQEFVWRSLGQVRAPGRLFTITDDGAFARIDGLDVNI